MGKAKSKTAEARSQDEAMSLRIDFQTSISLHEGDPSDFITVYEGDIVGLMDDDSESNIGKLTVYMVERGRVLNDGISLFDVMDCLDGDSCDCFANLFETETEELKTDVERLLSEDRALLFDMMLIERLELDPEHRGRGIGKEVALRVIEKLGTHCRIIGCLPAPLQFTGLGPRDNIPTGKRLAQQRVREFWEGVGFIRLKKTSYYIWPN